MNENASKHDAQYLKALAAVRDKGTPCDDRTGVGTISYFGLRMRFDLSEGFPILTTKRVWWRGVVEELLWFLRGEQTIQSLQARGVHIWDEWANEYGHIGPMYGHQWRSWWVDESHDPVDQIARVIESIKTNPDSRRHVVTAWNPADLGEMALAPCHVMVQFRVYNGKLSCALFQRSADMFLGVPFNIASYALLTHMIAHLCGLGVGEFVHFIGDAHIYNNHMPQVTEQLSRTAYSAPELHLNPGVKSIDDFTFEDLMLRGYVHHPAIKGEIAV